MKKEIIDEIVANNKFVPKFIAEADIFVCADLINKPHEDYPRRVDKTVEMITFATDELNQCDIISSFVMRHIHNEIMYDLRTKGTVRESCVHPEGGDKDTYFHPVMINDGLEALFPIDVNDHIHNENDLFNWYKAFQTVHPFDDGNGRVGGVIIAAISMRLFGYYLCPMQ